METNVATAVFQVHKHPRKKKMPQKTPNDAASVTRNITCSGLKSQRMHIQRPWGGFVSRVSTDRLGKSKNNLMMDRGPWLII